MLHQITTLHHNLVGSHWIIMNIRTSYWQTAGAARVIIFLWLVSRRSSNNISALSLINISTSIKSHCLSVICSDEPNRENNIIGDSTLIQSEPTILMFIPILANPGCRVMLRRIQRILPKRKTQTWTSKRISQQKVSPPQTWPYLRVLWAILWKSLRERLRPTPRWGIYVVWLHYH